MDLLLDLDGQSLMPTDPRHAGPSGQAVPRHDATDGSDQAPIEVARLPSAAVVIVPQLSMPIAGRITSIGAALNNQTYPEMLATIRAHLERSGNSAYYGVDGRAYFGGRTRSGSIEGTLDLVIPIFIAALSVMNTMLSSVYERQAELYVLSSVGLSPRHIRWLFFAEALVYAVLAAVGGYMFAQGLGAMLTWFGWTGALTMSYSSLSAVIVSGVLMLVVLASAILPARMASRLAAPSRLHVRRLPEADGDHIRLAMPFVFNRQDRIAMAPYLSDWLESYGEGSSSAFFASLPRWDVCRDTGGELTTRLLVTVWLRPYDLGVSQHVEVLVTREQMHGDLIAQVTLERASGDHSSWQRCNHLFVGLLRRRFLTWRGVGADDRQRLLERGRDMFDPERGGDA